MHKYLYCLFAVVLGVAIVLTGCTRTKKQEASVSPDQINEMIDYVILSDEYQEADYRQREKTVEKLLSNMKDSGYIQHYSFDDRAGLFSFVYPDGTLGGIHLNEFHNDKSPFPMNQ